MARDGCYVNWRWAAGGTLAQWADYGRPVHTWAAIFEDDIEVADNVLHRISSLAPGGFIASLYTAAHNHISGAGWHEVTELPRLASRALAIMMPMELIQTFMQSPPRPEWRDRTDHAIGLFCRATSTRWFTHSPSLVRHTAVEYENSALADPGGTLECRQCREFAERLK